MNCPYHLIYLPYDPISRLPERVLDLIQTNDAREVNDAASAIPGSIALQLDADTPEDAACELRELGFAF